MSLILYIQELIATSIQTELKSIKKNLMEILQKKI